MTGRTSAIDPVAWPRAFPRHNGAWTLRDSGGRWAAFDPDTSAITRVEPADDRALPALRGALGEGSLIGYRVGRRAVVATPRGYIKVVRPRRLAALVAVHEWLSTLETTARTPEVLAVDPAGAVELAPVRGDSLHELLRRPAPEALLGEAISAIATALADMHAQPIPHRLPLRSVDDPAMLIAMVERADPAAARALEAAAVRLPPVHAHSSSITHGDFHDKNILQACCGVGIIDLDSVAVGAPEDDVANLAVHLRLRVLQGSMPTGLGERLADRLVKRYTECNTLDADRLEAVAARTWFRLACTYRFRAASRHLFGELLRRAVENR